MNFTAVYNIVLPHGVFVVCNIIVTLKIPSESHSLISSRPLGGPCYTTCINDPRRLLTVLPFSFSISTTLRKGCLRENKIVAFNELESFIVQKRLSFDSSHTQPDVFNVTLTSMLDLPYGLFRTLVPIKIWYEFQISLTLLLCTPLISSHI